MYVHTIYSTNICYVTLCQFSFLYLSFVYFFTEFPLRNFLFQFNFIYTCYIISVFILFRFFFVFLLLLCCCCKDEYLINLLVAFFLHSFYKSSVSTDVLLPSYFENKIYIQQMFVWYHLLRIFFSFVFLFFFFIAFYSLRQSVCCLVLYL